MFNQEAEHCALYMDSGVYDVRGKISGKGFHKASEREIGLMKNNFVPKFDVGKLEEYFGQ